MSIEEVVQQQFEAYNNQDIEAYVDTFSDDVELLELPGNDVTISGKAALRVHYQARFRQNPNLHAELSQRMVYGNIVICGEVLHGLADSESVELMAIYQVENNLIRRIWFMR